MKYLLSSLFIILSVMQVSARETSVTSPDGTLKATLTDEGKKIQICIFKGEKTILNSSVIALDIQDVKQAEVIKKAKSSDVISEHIVSPFYRQAQFDIDYRKSIASLDNGVDIEIRAYDSGIAYRYLTKCKDSITVVDEKVSLALPSDLKAWLPYSTNDENPTAMAYQNIYDHTYISHAQDKLAFLPLTVDYGDGLKMTLTESDLVSYPGMFVKADTTTLILNGVFAKYPKTYGYYPWRIQQYVTSTEDFIARTAGIRAFPWRIMAITDDDTQMPVNNLVYALASAAKTYDISWIKGGKVAWDWWNDWGLRGVDFEAGINMPTYKKYIDFAAANNIEYVVLDEGWYESKSGDMLTPIPEIDVKALVDYGKERGVGIVLWCVFNVLDDRLEQICSTYSDMGVKGFKVDFLDRDDQQAVEMTYRIAEACSRHHLLLDYHGIYKPTGMNRTYPNVLNFESVFGMEEARWTTTDHDMPMYDVTFPYIRLLAGYVDYTPGAMRNGSKRDWQANYYNPISQGTRCHQIATYIVYDSPFTMLCDSPTAYEKEPECTDFLVDIPTVVDQTIVLAGEVGSYIVTARRSGDDWWIGGLTNWDGREVEVDMSFLSDGQYEATIMQDGVNADRSAEDYSKKMAVVTNEDKLRIKMASGGGFAIRLKK